MDVWAQYICGGACLHLIVVRLVMKPPLSADCSRRDEALSSKQRLWAEVCGLASGDAESKPAGEREGRLVMPQTLSHHGSDQPW